MKVQFKARKDSTSSLSFVGVADIRRENHM